MGLHITYLESARPRGCALKALAQGAAHCVLETRSPTGLRIIYWRALARGPTEDRSLDGWSGRRDVPRGRQGTRRMPPVGPVHPHVSTGGAEVLSLRRGGNSPDRRSSRGPLPPLGAGLVAPAVPRGGMVEVDNVVRQYAAGWAEVSGNRTYFYFEYNPTLVLLPAAVARRFAGRYSNPSPAYLSSFRVSAVHACLDGTIDPLKFSNKPKIKQVYYIF